MKGSDGPGAYELERRLLGHLGIHRQNEIQWDVIGWFALALFYLALPQIVDETVVTPRPCLGHAFAGGAALIGVLTLVASLRRDHGWLITDEPTIAERVPGRDLSASTHRGESG